MRLNVYEGNEVVKTFETQTFRLKWRISKQLLKIVDLNGFMNFETANLNDLITVVLPLMENAEQLITDIIHEMFPDITEDDLDNVDTIDIAVCIVEAFRYTIKRFKDLRAKNQ